MIENEALNGSSAYSMIELCTDMRNGVFAELNSSATVDVYRRNLQRAYIERLQYLMEKEQPSYPAEFADYAGITKVDVSQSDIRAIARAELKKIKGMATSAKPSDSMSQYHLDDLVARIDEILEGKK